MVAEGNLSGVGGERGIGVGTGRVGQDAAMATSGSSASAPASASATPRWIAVAWFAVSVPVTALCLRLTLEADDASTWLFALPAAPALAWAVGWLVTQPGTASEDQDAATKRPAAKGRAAARRAEAEETRGCLLTAARILGVLVAHALAVGLLVGAFGSGLDTAGTAVLVDLLLTPLVMLTALAAAMLLLGFGMGLVAVVRLVAARQFAVAAFASAFPLIFGGLILIAVGAASYDSPHRRDIRPLLGPVPADVDVHSHAMLQVGRVGMAAIILGVAIPFAFAIGGLALRRWRRSRGVTS